MVVEVRWLKAARSRAVRRTSLPGDATVTGIADTGAILYDGPVFRFTLDVRLPGRDRYPAIVKSAPSRVLAAAGAVRAGMWVPIRVNPDKPEKVTIEWSLLEQLPGEAIGRGVRRPELAAQLFDRLKGRYKWLGGSPHEVCTLTLTPGLARRLGIEHTEGLLVLHVPAGGTEARAGMVPGDVVTTTDGRPVRVPEDVVAIVSPKRRGEWVLVTLIRDGRELAVSVEKDF